ncbi:MAG TPA: hypothetical protein VLB44_10820 [Kofleriaceae bacterium]|nr:hypothetical protein [Kofleriaceae bacterium]
MRHLAAAIACALLLVPAVASAERGELTESSPSTLEPHEVRIGLFDVGVGLWGSKLLDRFEVSSHHFVWATWAGGLPSYDVHAKFEFWREDNLSMSVGGGITSIDLRPIVSAARANDMATELAFRVVPLEGWAGYRLGGRARLTAGAVYTHVSLGGHTEAGPIDELGGAIGTSNLELHGTGQVRLSRSWNVIVGARVLAYQAQYAQVRVAEMVGASDQGTVSNETRAEGDMFGVGGAWTANVAFHLARPHFNLRLGLEYGNYHVPMINLVVPSRGWMPTFDLYWRI